MWLFDNMKTRYKLILNSKPDKDLLRLFPNWQSRIDTLEPGINHVARFVPKGRRKNGWDDVLKFWQQGNVLFYFDEMPNHADGSEFSDELQKIYQTGASLGDGAIACSQRPVFVPNFSISESEHIFIFVTQLKSDRDKLEGVTGVDWEFIRDLPPYYCGYFGPGLQKPVILRPVAVQ